MTHDTQKPLISIITVCYNEAAAIEKTCQSIAAQSYSHIEWIVMDGGSKDGTVEILERYRSRMAHFVSEKDNSIYHAMNKGIRCATGDYLLFLNGGDALDNPSILQDIFGGTPVTGDILYGDIRLADGTLHKSMQNVTTIDYRFFVRPQSLNHQATFIKRRLFETYGLYDETMRYAADYEWFLRVFAKPHVSWRNLHRTISVFDPGGMSENKALWPKIFKEIAIAQSRVPIPFYIKWPAHIPFNLRRILYGFWYRKGTRKT